MRYISLFVLGLVAWVCADAQAIQLLPSDPAVISGALPNGMAYYIASNPALKGTADFALVQKTGGETIPDADRRQIVSLSQNCLTSQYRMPDLAVQDYFIRAGVVPGKEGFVQVTDNATVFRFPGVLLSRTETALDSTLLVLVGMAEKAGHCSDPTTSGWYSPADHAVVVAGDVDAAAVVEKLKMLSYIIPASLSLPRDGYEWTDRDSLCVRHSLNPERKIDVLTARWRLQRTPREVMNTVQPAIYERFMSGLGIVASSRIERRLRAADIPFADVSYDYINSLESLGDESFSISVKVGSGNLFEAVSAVACVMSELDSSKGLAGEIKRADLIFLDGLKDGSLRSEDNSDYVDRCVAAFIYNSALTSRDGMVDFHHSREINDDVRTRIFNSIASSSVDSTKNLILEYETDDPAILPDAVRTAFLSSWKSAGQSEGQPYPTMRTPLLRGPSEPVKIRKTKKEHMSGGTVLTMANGMKIIYRNIPSDGTVSYFLGLNGGYANIPDLRQGAGSYMSDILSLSRIGGVCHDDFMDVLRQNGMTLDMKIGLSSMSVSGTFRDNRFDFLMSALLTVLYDRKTDMEEYDYYVRCESLREESLKGTETSRISAISRIMFPDYRHTPTRNSGSLDSEFVAHADRFLRMQSEKLNDGVLILVGDIDEKVLRRMLQAYAGGFRTEGRTFSRPMVNGRPISGTVTKVVEGRANHIDMVMSTPMSLTAGNYYAAAIASMALRARLTEAESSSGMWVQVRHDCRRSPQERCNMMVSLGESSVDGYAPGTVHGDFDKALDLVRDVLQTASSLEIAPEDMSAYKAVLKQQVARKMETPEYWVRALAMRYADGKDFSTGADGWIESVTVEDVRGILKELTEGTRVEYITRRK